MSHELNVLELVRSFLEDLELEAIDPHDLEDLEPVFAVFCRHKRLLRFLLTLCE